MGTAVLYPLCTGEQGAGVWADRRDRRAALGSRQATVCCAVVFSSVSLVTNEAASPDGSLRCSL